MYAIFVPTVVGYTFAKTDVSNDKSRSMATAGLDLG